MKNTLAAKWGVALLVMAVPATILALIITFGFPKAQAEWSRGNGEFSIVATTNVWADLAYQVGGEAVTAHAIISNINQDPHSYEASAREQLLINQADLVLMNGGGYDDFMITLVAGRTGEGMLIKAVETAGTRADGNEHIWLSVERVRIVAAKIAELIKRETDDKVDAQIDANLATVNQKLDEIAAKEASIKEKLKSFESTNKSVKVLQTEPLGAYLLEDCGYEDVTPNEFIEAIEEQRDIPPATIEELRTLLNSGEISFVLINSSSSTEQVRNAFGSPENIPFLGLSELLSQDPDTYEYDGDYFDYLYNAVAILDPGFWRG